MPVSAMASRLAPNPEQRRVLPLQVKPETDVQSAKKQEWLLPVFSGPDSGRAIVKEGRKEGCRMP